MTDAHSWSWTVAWMATLMVHSTVLIAAVWAMTRRTDWIRPAWRDVLWKTALVAPLLTTSLQLFAGVQPLGGQLGLPIPSASAVADRSEVEPAGWGIDEHPGEGLLVIDTATEPGFDTSPLRAKPAPPAVSAPVGPLAQLPRWWPMATVFVWAFVAAGLLAHLAWRYFVLRQRLSGRRLVEDESIIKEILELRQRAGVRRRIAVSELDGLRSPVAYGRSDICLPAAMVRQTPASSLRTVLGHELAHLERADYHWLMVASVIEEALFFQPLFRLARREMQRGAEFLCDDFAVAHGSRGAGHGLAQVLAELATLHREPTASSLAQLPAMQPHSGLLLARVERLLDPQHAPQTRPAWSRRLAVAMLLGLGLLVAAPAIVTAAPPPKLDPASDVTPTTPPTPGDPERVEVTTHDGEGTTMVIVRDGATTTLHTRAQDNGSRKAKWTEQRRLKTRRGRQRKGASANDRATAFDPAPGVRIIKDPVSGARTMIVQTPADPPRPPNAPTAPAWSEADARAVHPPRPTVPAPPAPPAVVVPPTPGQLALPPLPGDLEDRDAMDAWQAEVAKRAEAWERAHGDEIRERVERQLRRREAQLREREEQLRESADRIREQAERHRDALERARTEASKQRKAK